MGLEATPSSERVRIGFFGRRNAGKSSLANALAGQDIAVVSETAGTTTDPVRKAMELEPAGPVVLVDTPGIDDVGDLGEMRVERARSELARCDVAVVVADAREGLGADDEALIEEIGKRGMGLAVVFSKADLLDEGTSARPRDEGAFLVSSATGEGIEELRVALGKLAARARESKDRPIAADLMGSGGLAVLVCPLDGSAPKGRLILPQQLVLRDLLDAHLRAIVCQPEELSETLDGLVRPPSLVICDSQAFEQVGRIVPEDVPLTSFSILMARHKSQLGPFVRGAAALSRLGDGSRVLIAEGCTHHRQCQDIGTVKLPAWIREHAGADPDFEFCSGGDFPADLSGFDVVVHCGACMLGEPEVADRVARAEAAGVPIVNYGMAIAHMKGLLARSLEPFGEAALLAERR